MFCFVFFFFFRYGFVSFFFFLVVLVWIVEVLFLCELVSVDRFMYYHVLVSLKIICCLICDFYLLPFLFEPNSCGSFVIHLLS